MAKSKKPVKKAAAKAKSASAKTAKKAAAKSVKKAPKKKAAGKVRATSVSTLSIIPPTTATIPPTVQLVVTGNYTTETGVNLAKVSAQKFATRPNPIPLKPPSAGGPILGTTTPSNGSGSGSFTLAPIIVTPNERFTIVVWGDFQNSTYFGCDNCDYIVGAP